MIRFKVRTDGRTMIGLGVTRENVARLTAGQPILVRGESVHMPGMDIVVFYGETEKVMYDEMKKAGYIDHTTTIIKEQTS